MPACGRSPPKPGRHRGCCAAASAPMPVPSARPACRCSSVFPRAPTCCADSPPPLSPTPPRRPPMPEGTPHLLELRNISKTFPGVKALQNVQLHANKGLVHALMGENGAGKSTLMKILSGAYMPDPGAEIRIDGKAVTIDGPLAAKALGVSVIYQELSLAPNLTVAENIYMGRPMVKGAQVDRAGMAESCAATLQRLGADFGPSTIVESLSIAQRQLVEI